MVNIQLFKNDRFGEVRVVEIEGKTYFVGIDVTRALGYKNVNDAITRHCRGCVKHAVPDNQGFNQMTNVIPEGDIYRLAAKSELPAADEFESWIFDEILPSIRKHGAYLTPQKIEEALLNPDTLIMLATNLKHEREKRIDAERQFASQQKQLSILKPKAEIFDKIMDADEKIDVGQAAKILGLPFGRNTLFKKLKDKGVFFKNRNEPKQEYIERGYFELKEKWIDRNNHDGFMVVKVLVNQKGLSFINRIFDNEIPSKKLAAIT